MEKPINFTAEMIEKILDGTKSQTRRPCKSVPESAYAVDCYFEYDHWYFKCGYASNVRYNGTRLKSCVLDWTELDWTEPVKFRYNYKDLLYVKEAWQTVPNEEGDGYAYVYRASQNVRDWEENTEDWKWKSPLFMPKEAARIWLEVEDRRVERVQDISIEDAIEEGALLPFVWMRYRHIWEGIYNEKHKPEFMWERNPFVEAYKFRRVEHG